MGKVKLVLPLQFIVTILLGPHYCATQVNIETMSCVTIKADDVREILHSARRLQAFTCMLEVGARDHPDDPLEDPTNMVLKCLSDAGISPRYDVVKTYHSKEA